MTSYKHHIYINCRTGSLYTVIQYINKGGDPNCKDSQGGTLLHNACCSHNHLLVRYLCEVVNNSTSSKNDYGNTPLHLACFSGDYQIVKYLIDDRKCETNTKNNQGNVPLQAACYGGHLEVVKHMIKTGRCDTTIRGFSGESLLHTACRSSNLELVQYLVNEEGFDIHQRTETQRRLTTLHVATQFSSIAVVQWLVQQGLDPEEGDETGVTPLHTAKGGGAQSMGIVKYFFEPEPIGLNCNPYVCTVSGETPLHFAVRYNKIEVVKYLIKEKKCDPMHSDNNGNTCPHLAAASGAFILLRFLNGLGCNMDSKNKEGNTALYLACRRGHLEVVKYMIKTGCCDTTIIGFEGESLLHAACRSSNLELVQYLVNEDRFDIHQRREDKGRKTAVNIDSQFSSIAVVQWLVQQGLNPEGRDKTGATPLHVLSDMNILKSFLEREPLSPNCNVNICSVSGETPLHGAVGYDKFEVIKYLISENKCDHMQSDSDGDKCPHIAARNGALIVLRFLNVLGCNMNSENKQGDSALCLACKNGHLEVVKYMIKTGHCDTTIRGFSGESLLHAACRSSNLELVQYLVNEERFDIHQRTDNKRRRTALHVASEFSSIAVVHWLVQQGLSPEERDEIGVTSLHTACGKGGQNLDIVKYFLEPEPSGLKCNPNMCSDAGNTPLHFTVHCNKIEVVKYLINEKKCDPMQSDNDGNTCPHLAAANGSLACLEFLHQLGCDMNSTLKGGWSPLHYALLNNNPTIVRFLLDVCKCELEFSKTPMSVVAKLSDDCVRCILQCVSIKNESKRKFLELLKRVPSYLSQMADKTIKLVVLGDSRSGKSTLVKTLMTEYSDLDNFFFRFWREEYKTVSDVEEYTAGIVTHKFESKHFGHVLIFDFAGHEEYHASHSEIMAKFLLQDSIVLLVADISKDDKEVKVSLKRWLRFVDRLCSRANTHSQLVVIGSHLDMIVDKTTRQIKEKVVGKIIESFEGEVVSKESIAFIPLDCRRLLSDGISSARDKLRRVSEKMRDDGGIDFRCLQIVEYIQNKYPHSYHCTVKELHNGLHWSEVDYDTFMSLLVCLQSKGYVIISRRSEDIPLTEQLIIFNYSNLLKVVNGSVFAPANFQAKFPELATNTGIVTLTKIKEVFSNICGSIEVVISFLEHFQFCIPLTSSSALVDIDEQPLQSTNSVHQSLVPYPEECYFFFPALATKPRDAITWSTTDPIQCCWLLTVSEKSVFPPEFLHHILLHLVLNYLEDPNEEVDCAPVIQRKCELWRTGVFWSSTKYESSAMVEMIEGGSLVFMVSGEEHSAVNLARLRSKVVYDLLKIKRRICRQLKVVEMLIPKSLLDAYQPNSSFLSSVESFSVTAVADCIKQCRQTVVNSSGKKRNVSEVMPVEPFLMISTNDQLPLASTIIHGKSANITPSFIQDMAVVAHPHTQHFIKMLQVNPVTLLRKLTSLPSWDQFEEVMSQWVEEKGGNATFSNLFRELSCYSLFCGRNPLTMEWVCQPDHYCEPIEEAHRFKYSPTSFNQLADTTEEQQKSP